MLTICWMASFWPTIRLRRSPSSLSASNPICAGSSCLFKQPIRVSRSSPMPSGVEVRHLGFTRGPCTRWSRRDHQLRGELWCCQFTDRRVVAILLRAALSLAAMSSGGSWDPKGGQIAGASPGRRRAGAARHAFSNAVSALVMRVFCGPVFRRAEPLKWLNACWVSHCEIHSLPPFDREGHRRCPEAMRYSYQKQ